jgi:formate C-acetyltransferase
MSCVSAETLHAAQEDPKAHKEVIVRVAGYSAYFVTLTNMMQNEIIARTEQTKV